MTRRCLAIALSLLIIPATLVAGPVQPATAASVIHVSVGSLHACGLTSVGTAYCWGGNSNAQVDGSQITRPTPTAVSGGFTFSALSPGDSHTCGLTSAGAAYCWGYNVDGERGDGTTNTGYSPTAVSGGLTFTSITAGAYHTCGLTSAGAAWCWGSNAEGQLGDNTIATRLTPVAVQQGAMTFSSIAAGGAQTCGLTSAGAAWCWGYNGEGALGDNTTTNRWTPTAVSGGLTFTSLTGGVSNHTCGLTSGGAAYCWGYNAFGQLGDNTTTQRNVPTAVSGGLTFTQIAPGPHHTCGLVSGGTAYCWGSNANGELGDGTTTERHAPTAVSGSLSFNAVSAGGNHWVVEDSTCGVSAGNIYCWGDNTYGQLGDGTTTEEHAPVLNWLMETDAGVAVSFGMDPQLTFTVSSVAGALGCGDVTTTVASTTNAVSLRPPQVVTRSVLRLMPQLPGRSAGGGPRAGMLGWR